MDRAEKYKEALRRVKGKTIAIVYIFEGEDAPGFGHYDIWKSDVIGQWLEAIQKLKCMPLILDVRTFVDKAMNRTLPHIDFVLNLNAGSKELSPMALVPSVSSFIGVPCIPCNAVTIVTGESKRLSNLIAIAEGLNVPKEVDKSDKYGIFRPLNFGSSIGVRRGHPENSSQKGLYQQFITGFDITTPIMYNPLLDSLELLPTIIYVPEQENGQWFFGEDEKHCKQGYRREILSCIDPLLKSKYIKICEDLSIKTYCRIDARITSSEEASYSDVDNALLSLHNTYFIEINPMPTIKEDNSYGFSFSAIDCEDSFSLSIDVYKTIFESISVHSFLLANSIIAMC